MTRNHVIWLTVGVAAGFGLWYAWSVPGAIAMLGSIAISFWLWKRIGPKGSWLALIALGVILASYNGAQAFNGGGRCPSGDTKVFLKENKPPVGCDEIRAASASMALFFAIVAGIGIYAPFYARSLENEPDPDIDPDHEAIA